MLMFDHKNKPVANAPIIQLKAKGARAIEVVVGPTDSPQVIIYLHGVCGNPLAFESWALAASQHAKIAVLMIPDVSERVKDSLEKSAAIISTLDETYSKEASRLADGGKLTAKEKDQLEQLQSQQKDLLIKLDELEKTVAKNNEEMKKSIEDIRKKSNRIQNASHNHADFCHALFAARFAASVSHRPRSR